MSKTKHQGFTLIEIAVVSSIIAIVAALLIPSVFSTKSDAQKTRQDQVIASVETAKTRQILANSAEADSTTEFDHLKPFLVVAGKTPETKTELVAGTGKQPSELSLGKYTTEPAKWLSGYSGPFVFDPLSPSEIANALDNVFPNLLFGSSEKSDYIDAFNEALRNGMLSQTQIDSITADGNVVSRNGSFEGSFINVDNPYMTNLTGGWFEWNRQGSASNATHGNLNVRFFQGGTNVTATSILEGRRAYQSMYDPLYNRYNPTNVQNQNFNALATSSLQALNANIQRGFVDEAWISSNILANPTYMSNMTRDQQTGYFSWNQTVITNDSYAVKQGPVTVLVWFP